MDVLLATFAANAAAVLGAMVLLWLLSLALRDASIVDPFWPVAFVLIAWLTFARADVHGPRHWLLALLATAWGLRLGGYLLWRNHGKGEDFRYRAMRERGGPGWWWKSLFVVFGLQGVLALVVSLPLQAGLILAEPAGIGLLEAAGLAAWAVGFTFETVGDWQLARFKADPASRGRVLDTGLWRYTRHPNYFGDFMVWWGLWLLAARGAWWSALGPAVMSVLLLRVSGVALLERDIAERRPRYRDYIARTNAFFPGPPRPPAGG